MTPDADHFRHKTTLRKLPVSGFGGGRKGHVLIVNTVNHVCGKLIPVTK